MQHASKTEAANKRRRFILRMARENGEVDFATIRKEFPGVGNQSLYGDDDLFHSLGLEVRLEAGTGKFILQKPLFWTYAVREGQNTAAKKALADFATGMIWGQRAERRSVLGAIQKQNAGATTRQAAHNIMAYLEDYWNKKSRTICLDAGSTTVTVAKALAARDLPDEEAGLAGMRVITNCPKIEVEFENPKIRTQVILIGGALRKETRAHTGLLTEQCLKAMNVHFDLSMIGTTGLMLQKAATVPSHLKVKGLSCDSEDEALTKALLLSRATLKCVLMDSSKFEVEYTSAFGFTEFAGLSSEAINLVITDDACSRKPDRERRRRRERMIAQIREAGIAVVEAE